MFPFSVHQNPNDGLWSVVHATGIVCHLTDEVTAKELTAKAFPDFPLIDEAFAQPVDVLEWRATWQQAVAATLAQLNEDREALADATADELDSINESIDLLNEVAAEQSRELRRATLLRELAIELGKAAATQQRIAGHIITPGTPKTMRDTLLNVAPVSPRILEIQRELREL